jgi:transposase InsO family protein
MQQPERRGADARSRRAGRRLRRVVADLMLDKEMLQEVIPRKYDASSGTRDDRLRACCVPANIPTCRATYHYRSRRPEQAPLRQRIREIAETRIRYGYRRITVLLRGEGWHVNVERVHRLYRLEGLQIRFKPPRRRVMAKLRDDRSNATGPNQVWAMDWMHDELSMGCVCGFPPS